MYLLTDLCARNKAQAHSRPYVVSSCTWHRHSAQASYIIYSVASHFLSHDQHDGIAERRRIADVMGDLRSAARCCEREKFPWLHGTYITVEHSRPFSASSRDQCFLSLHQRDHIALINNKMLLRCTECEIHHVCHCYCPVCWE